MARGACAGSCASPDHQYAWSSGGIVSDKGARGWSRTRMHGFADGSLTARSLGGVDHAFPWLRRGFATTGALLNHEARIAHGNLSNRAGVATTARNPGRLCATLRNPPGRPPSSTAGHERGAVAGQIPNSARYPRDVGVAAAAQDARGERRAAATRTDRKSVKKVIRSK